MIVHLATLMIAAAPVSESGAPSAQQWAQQFVQDFAVDTGRVMLRPALLQPDDIWLLMPTVLGTGLALFFDISLHKAIRDSLPDPILFERRFSYWGSYLGDGLVDVLILAVVGLADLKREGRVFLEGLEALAAAAITSRAFKLLLRIERPSFDPDAKHIFSRRWTADAMPSGHAMTAFATAAVLAREYPACAPIVYALALYLGVARIQQSTHWVSDVIVGGAIGLLYGWAAVDLRLGQTRVAVMPLGPSFTKDGGAVVVSGDF